MTISAKPLMNEWEPGGGNVPLVLVVEDQGGAVIRWSADDVSPPLRAQEHGHQPLLVMDEDADRRCGESE